MAGKNRKKARRKKRKQRAMALKIALQQKENQIEELVAEEEEAQDTEVAEELAEDLIEDSESEQLLDIIDDLSDEELEEVIEQVAEAVEGEVEEKHFGSVGLPLSGATSFDELDEERDAREKTSKARGVAWDAEDLIGNVIRSPLLKAGEKTSKISQVAKDMEERINSVLGETKEIQDDPTPSEAVGLLVKAVLQRIGIKPTEKESNSFIINKDLNGDLRWVGKATSRWIDREGDILTNASHKEFAGYLDENPDMAPMVLPWHNIKAAFTHPVDSWMYKNGFMIYSGKLEEHEAKSLITASKKSRLGMSHGFFALDREKSNKKNITKYRTFEVSVLPLHNAANPYTELEVIAKEANMERKEFLTDLLGEEKATKFLQEVEQTEEALDGAGVKTKDTPDTSEQDAVMEKIGKALGMPELSEAFVAMTKELKTLREGQASRDEVIKLMAAKLDVTEEEQTEQLAKMIEAPASRFAWQRPSQDPDTVLKEDDKEDEELSKAAPDLHWLNQDTHTQPIKPTKQELAALKQ